MTKTTHPGRPRLVVVAVALAALAGSSLAAHAQERGGHGGKGYQGHAMERGAGMHQRQRGWGGHGMRHHMRTMMERYDVDGDGRITREEIEQVQAERFEQASDGEGSIDIEAYAEFWLEENRLRMVRAFQRLDRDGDGEITEEEFNYVTERMMQRMDRGDGELRMRPSGRERSERRWGGRGERSEQARQWREERAERRREMREERRQQADDAADTQTGTEGDAD